MPRTRSTLAGLAFLMLVACGAPAPESDEDAADTASAALGRDTDETVFDDMTQTQDKARAVEGITLGHKDDLDAAMERSEGDAPADE